MKHKKPTLTIRGPGEYVLKEWHVDGRLHREEGPAAVHIDESGTFSSKWYLNGLLHREEEGRRGGPAYIEKSQYSQTEIWYFEGKIHKKSGPAYIVKTVNFIDFGWYEHGKFIKCLRRC